MIRFNLRGVGVLVTKDNYLIDSSKIEKLAYLANELTRLIPGTYAEIELGTRNVVSIIDALDEEKKITFDIVNEEDQILVKYDDLIVNAINIIRKYKAVFLKDERR